MPANSPPPEDVAGPVAALRTQPYPHWELCLIAAEELPPLVKADRRIRPLSLAPAATLGSGAILAVLDAADRLPPHALPALAAEFAAHPGAVLVYSARTRPMPPATATAPGSSRISTPSCSSSRRNWSAA